jgi:hypothetical protein
MASATKLLGQLTSGRSSGVAGQPDSLRSLHITTVLLTVNTLFWRGFETHAPRAYPRDRLDSEKVLRPCS